METLVIGDHFIAAQHYVEALRQVCGEDFGPVRTVDWAGTKAEQHHVQQQMEWNGVDAAPLPTEVIDSVGDAEVLTMHFAAVPAAALEAGKRLRAVVVARAGLENVDLAAATERGIAVSGVSGRNASAVAELALGMMLSESRGIARSDAMIKSGGWREPLSPPGTEVAHGTVGMVGFGQVGRQLAQRLAGFHVRLLVADPYVEESDLRDFGGQRVDLADVFRESDYVVLQARLTPETERFINDTLFALMKPTAYFINVARSRLVDYDALYAVLSEGRIAGAGLDVYDAEPLAADSPWRALGNVTLTPHYGGDTQQTNRTSARLVAEAVAELAQTGRIAGAVNAEALGWN
ncbi:MAG TPA: NAD(P)-dependent oxidoreductase [Mycobacteriales bacterium]|nr:NAD(P)-dependent oxidoreductase [Mycobacteriales bacterium]